MESPISRAEHEEFARRINEENKRQNNRLKLLEEQTRQMADIVASVRELALSVKQMAETQRDQGEKLEKLEGRDGEKWREVASYVVLTTIGIVIGFLFQRIGITK